MTMLAFVRVMLVFFLFLMFVSSARAGVPVTAGVLTNPAANAILADSGEINDGQHEMQLILSSNVAAVIFFEHRNTANTGNVFTQAFLIGANQSFTVKIDKFVTLNAGERFRLRLNSGVTGTLQGSINVD
jgi:hypothetical protein